MITYPFKIMNLGTPYRNVCCELES